MTQDIKRKVHIIINPASGREEPILSYINKVFLKTGIAWEVSVTHKIGDAYVFAKKALSQKVDVIAVYGGDGTVMEVVQALHKKNTPLLIVPGGTANVFAKEIKLPTESWKALALLKKPTLKIKKVDMGIFDGKPFVIRINFGILAKMVIDTSRKTKEQFGQVGYTAAAIHHIITHDEVPFLLEIDGKKIHEKGVALMVANAGNIGITGFSLLPRISVTDGFLDIVLFKYANTHSLFIWLKSIITSKKPQGSVKHWRGKEVTLTFNKKHPIICDDQELLLKSFAVSVSPKSLSVVVS